MPALQLRQQFEPKMLKKARQSHEYQYNQYLSLHQLQPGRVYLWL